MSTNITPPLFQISSNWLEKNGIAIISHNEKEIVVSIKSDTTHEKLDDLSRITHRRVILFSDQLRDTNQATWKESNKTEATEEQSQIGDYLEATIKEALGLRASDIHIEPFEKRLRIRYRIDGVLQEVSNPPKNKEAALLTKIKLLSKMDIAEKRLPQDGRFMMNFEKISIDVRVASLPSLHGESITMRLLRKYEAKDLDHLGLEENEKHKLQESIIQQNGLFLVTGPTGSGKTTTLYALLQRLNQRDTKILTVEDPIEYDISGINQTQVTEKMGFSEILRSMLRQAPNIIMVGEIRDAETAQIAAQASLTGHLVLSSLHTDNTISTIMRLLDLGLEQYVLAASLKGILSQRLIRLLCSCATIDDSILAQNFIKLHKANTIIKKSVGCIHCAHMGYLNRIGIFELLIVNELLSSLIYSTKDVQVFQKYFRDNQIKSLREDGACKILRGMTSLEEVSRAMA